jgi:hypothetical protein
MASYVFTFAASSSDLATYKEIELEPSLGGYAQANSGHQAIDISVNSSNTGAAHTLQLAWADGTTAATSNLGVTKVDTITATPGARRAPVGGGATGDYVCAVSAASSSGSLVRTVGVGDVIDTRVTPSTVLPKRRLFIGATALAGGGTVTVIVTPTKII